MSDNNILLNSANVKEVIKYIEKMFNNEDIKVDYELKDGKYTFIVNGYVIAQTNSNITVNETINQINESAEKNPIFSSKARITHNPTKLSNNAVTRTGINRMNGDVYELNIDTVAFEEVLNNIKSASSKFPNSSMLLSLDGMITGELLQYYNNMSDKVSITKLVKTKELVQDLSLKIDASLQAYTNIDDELRFGLESIISTIFSLGNSYLGDEYSTLSTLEEKTNYINNLLGNFEKSLAEFEKNPLKRFLHFYLQYLIIQNFPNSYLLLNNLLIY